MKEKLGGIFDGFILLAIGGFASYLILSGNYWYYINPKFEWLTGLTALMLIVTGAATFIKPKRSLSYPKVAVFLVFIVVLTSGAYFGIPHATQAQSDSSSEGASDEESRITLDGIEYIKINLTELLWLSEKDLPESVGEHYVVRGIVTRSEHLDGRGYFAVVRNFVWCCQADSIGMGLPVKYSRMKDFSEGQWVEIYGTLERLREHVPTEELRNEGMRIITLSSTYRLAPTKIVKIEEPEIPFIFEARDNEPYAF
jgi:uncharacterized repeat protein (TIGR03943 family)